MTFPLQRTFPTSSVSLWMRRILSIRSSPFPHRCGESRQTSQPDVKEHGKASEDGPVNSGELHSRSYSITPATTKKCERFQLLPGKLPSQILCHFEGCKCCTIYYIILRLSLFLLIPWICLLFQNDYDLFMSKKECEYSLSRQR